MRFRLYQNSFDNSLVLRFTISQDTGEYTCVASNGIDEDEASAQLIVQGPHEALGLHHYCYVIAVLLVCYAIITRTSLCCFHCDVAAQTVYEPRRRDVVLTSVFWQASVFAISCSSLRSCTLLVFASVVR